MSAWIVSKNHIRLLVEAVYKYEVVPDDTTPDSIGQTLWRENYRSVNYRYQERQCVPHYTHDSVARATWLFPSQGQGIIRELVRNPGFLDKQIRCYGYQSCERPDWESTQAYALMQALQKAVAYKGKDIVNAPWGID